jgi:hypothetical protein
VQRCWECVREFEKGNTRPLHHSLPLVEGAPKSEQAKTAKSTAVRHLKGILSTTFPILHRVHQLQPNRPSPREDLVRTLMTCTHTKLERWAWREAAQRYSADSTEKGLHHLLSPGSYPLMLILLQVHTLANILEANIVIPLSAAMGTTELLEKILGYATH